ncbi:predicted protein [Streptomyces sp. C]|nr:predicted protein [Streptomyces sp. C]
MVQWRKKQSAIRTRGRGKQSREAVTMNGFKLGEPLDQSREGFHNVAPPVVFSTQATGFVELKTPEELRAWEVALRTTTGMEISAEALAGHTCETGCGPNCCCDKCDAA